MIIMIQLLKLKKISNLVSSRLTLLVVCLSVLTSCVDENDKLGLSLVQSSGGLDVLSAENSNVTLQSAVYGTDSLETAQKDNFVLGTYKDEYFGQITSSIYTSMTLQDNVGINFADLGTIDSVVLCLAYSSSGAFIKDTSLRSDIMNINVYLLNEAIDSTKKYAGDDIPVQNTPIFSGNAEVNPAEGVVVGGKDTLNPHLRLTLSGEFIEKLKNSSYENQQEFADDLKGLKICATSSSNAFLAYIDMKSSNSGLFVYYHRNDFSSKYIINFTGSGYRFMHIDKDYSSSSLSGITSYADTLSTQDYIYIGSLGVAESKITINGIPEWYNQDSVKGCAINRAELILPVADLLPQSHLYPSSLLVLRKENGLFGYISDEISVNNWLGNKYDASINAFRLDITSFIQNVALGKITDCTLYLIPDSRTSSASRVILNGPASSNPPKLNIIYSHPASD